MVRKFMMIDEAFKCEICGADATPLGYTARDHCPLCLSSKHVDNNPGDREAGCEGTLVPIGIEKAKKGDYKIVYKCDKCGVIKKNVAATDDNMELIIKLSSKPLKAE
ncbi:MAG: hypothetical protein A2Y22_02575 [Clostridiales bacterium GWD2_32_59]|nr:MAG: hypothetical protein A2Y22_02575 [Clostridiales bacterium GWD2_32_59]